MKYSLVIVTTITLIAAFVLSGCEQPSDKMEEAEISVIEANRDMEIAKSEVEADLRIFRAENEDRITGYNQTIGEIKRKINNETDSEVKASLERKLQEYEATHRDLKREMDTYTFSGRDNWNDFKNSFNRRMDALGDSLNDFFSTSGTNPSANMQ